LLAGAEVGVHVEEVLDAVAVVARLEGDLPERRADPQGGDAEPPQVAELAPQPFQRAALPAAAGAEPGVVIDPAGVLGPVQGCGAAGRRAVVVVPVAALLLAVGEAVQQQEVQNLVLPGGRRRGERPPRQGGEVEIQQALLDRLGHLTLLAGQRRIPSSSRCRSKSATSRYTRKAPAWYSRWSPRSSCQAPQTVRSGAPPV